MNEITTMNPLTRKSTVSERYSPHIGDRIGFNPGKRGLPVYVVGNVDGCSWHNKYGRIVSLKLDDGTRLTGLAIDHITVKVISTAKS